MNRLPFISGFSTGAVLLLLSLAIVNRAAADAIVIPSSGSYSNPQSAAPAGEMSVLERFRTYTGHRTTSGLTGLFEQSANRIVRQLPAIAMSDGRTAVIIVARIVPVEGRAINFSLEGASLISAKKIRADEWEIKALPVTGTVNLSLMVMNGAETVTYPLIIAPQLPRETDLSLSGFQDYLEQSGGRDLNGDGRRDYLDDYIYTANYLTKQQSTGRDKSARQQRAIKRTLAVKPESQKPEYDPSLFSE